MSYINGLSADQLKNVNLIIDAMRRYGIKNPFTQAAILSVISKESAFRPQAEKNYANTSNSRIREIFGSRVSHLNDSELNQLKRDEVAFFNTVYGGRYGNSSNEGWLYRGRGFNQVTFRGNYAELSRLVGVDLVSNPDKLSDPKVAAKVAILYFLKRFKKDFSTSHQDHYGSKDINGFKNLPDSVLAIYHANAGFGKPLYTINSISSTGGLKKSVDRSPEFLEYVKSYNGSPKKMVVIFIVISLLIALSTFGILLLTNKISF